MLTDSDFESLRRQCCQREGGKELHRPAYLPDAPRSAPSMHVDVRGLIFE